MLFRSFSLAARLYSIFALFALLTAAIAVLSDYNTRKAAELTSAIETANLAALNVERVNSLVYAVVMESRGVYMSEDAATRKKYAEGLLQFNDQIAQIVDTWERKVRPEYLAQFTPFAARVRQFIEFRKELARLGVEVGQVAGRTWGDNDANRAVRKALNQDLETLERLYSQQARNVYEIGRAHV